jgi:hypothetical protein
MDQILHLFLKYLKTKNTLITYTLTPFLSFSSFFFFLFFLDLFNHHNLSHDASYIAFGEYKLRMLFWNFLLPMLDMLPSFLARKT